MPFQNTLARFARWLAIKTDQRVLSRDGAALILSQHAPMEVVLPKPGAFLDDASARSALMLVTAAGVILRDHAKNLTLYEGLVEGAKELGFGPDAGAIFAGSLINPQET